MAKYFSEELQGIKPEENITSSNVNPNLKRLIMNTVHNKEEFEDWLSNPELEKDLKINANLRSEKTTDTNNVSIGEEVKITKEINTNKIEVEGEVYWKNKKILEHVYPIGSLFITVGGINPYDLFGFGEWRSFTSGSGRVLVGLDEFDNNFNILGLRGGVKTVRLSQYTTPTHNHNYSFDTDGDMQHSHDFIGTVSDKGLSQKSGRGWRTVLQRHSSKTYYTDYASSAHEHQDTTSQNTGGNQSHNNLQPYITVYIWVRVG